MKIKVGVIGCGQIAQVGHLPGLTSIPEVELVAVADIDEKKAKNAASKFGAQYYFTDWKELIALNDIKAVSVAVPNYLHAEMTIAACNAGKHVLCEKPMATSLDEAWAMIEASRKNNVKLEICMAHRYNPAAQTAKDILDSGLLGKVNMVMGYYGSPGPEYWSPDGKWFFDKKQAFGGSMADLGIHEIDLIRFLIGSDIAKASGFISTLEKKNATVEDNGIGTLVFENGTLCTMYASWTYKPGNSGLTLFCEKGTLYFGPNPFTDKPVAIQLMDPPGLLIPEVLPKSKWGDRYQHFIKCILEDKVPASNGWEGYKGLEVITAIYESSETGKTISLPMVPRT